MKLPRHLPSLLALLSILFAHSGCEDSTERSPATHKVYDEPKRVAYVIDTSKSMLRGNMYERLLTDLENRYAAHLDDGIRCAVFTFDHETVKRDEFDVRGQDRIRQTIQALRQDPPNGQYTNLTGAVYHAARWIREVAGDDLGGSEVYIFTDGKHDPPPDAAEPNDWKSVMRDEFAGGIVRNDGVGVYLVQLPGSELDASEIPEEIEVVEAPAASEQITRSILRFEDVNYYLDEIEVKANPDGRIPAEKCRQRAEITLKAAHALPPGEPKDIALDGGSGVSLSPTEMRFTKQGQKKDLSLDFPIGTRSETIELQVRITPKTSGLECDERVVVHVPVKIKVSKPPLWQRVKSWILDLPRWLQALLLLLILVLLACLALPKFRKQTISTGEIDYRLKNRARLCGHRISLGPRKGVPFGETGGVVAVLTATWSGDVILHRKRKGLKVDGEELTGPKVRLGSYADIEYEEYRAEYSSG
ncbi:MAG: vWA domain-containing protein [Candidatus Eisenbacteria bacterium]